ncbi:hypothetical protein [Agromyces seonyuensis]|uniref:DUF5667 domain-containing protein n=1 Tax=Agromyces seonyuensis TaxID=2662446 RepID=A0A6I4NZB5_9MICO|nr:hypothetical protein [Agromyces seonyuensis]MWB99653.1 hypothetical protein [Agromyces seonyuensis]
MRAAACAVALGAVGIAWAGAAPAGASTGTERIRTAQVDGQLVGIGAFGYDVAEARRDVATDIATRTLASTEEVRATAAAELGAVSIAELDAARVAVVGAVGTSASPSVLLDASGVLDAARVALQGTVEDARAARAAALEAERAAAAAAALAEAERAAAARSDAQAAAPVAVAPEDVAPTVAELEAVRPKPTAEECGPCAPEAMVPRFYEGAWVWACPAGTF